ncbi:hypothetical protein SteCoe_16445 [Stentor coeruleus]|uniref:NET domain-containing protein n=1 Tax=Stentor coeruleus TaxID=5963 RepID=A0A1R2C143_9CILI|nr:hypothetical protein SteCoe_16445 [Stentor coeruleus]
MFLEKQTIRYCNKLRLKIPYSNKKKTNNDTMNDDMKSATYEDKWNMTESIRTLDQIALEKVIEVVKEKSPESIEILDTDKIKIKLDVISRETFNHIQTIIDESTLESLR